MIWAKGTHQTAEFQTFNCSREISPNLYFDSFLLSKIYKISAKKSIEDLRLKTLKIDTKFEEKLICCFRNDKNLVNFIASTRKFSKFPL